MPLVVIDCQPRYFPHGPFLEAACKEVAHSRRRGDPIVFLEYFRASQTWDHILAEVAGYERFEVRSKENFGGADEVIEACTGRGWDMSSFRLVGAETYCCVAETAEGLNLKLPESLLFVVRAACFDKYVGGPFPRHENIVWV
jgi:hypothetical protein